MMETGRLKWTLLGCLLKKIELDEVSSNPGWMGGWTSGWQIIYPVSRRSYKQQWSFLSLSVASGFEGSRVVSRARPDLDSSSGCPCSRLVLDPLLIPAPNGVTRQWQGKPAMCFFKDMMLEGNTSPPKNQEARVTHGSLCLSVFSSHIVKNQQMLFTEIQQSFLAPAVLKQMGAGASK